MKDNRTGEYSSLATAISKVRSWLDLAPQRRATMIAALRAVARLDGRPPETIPLDPINAVASLERATPAELGVRPGTLHNYRSALRWVLRRLGGLENPAARSAGSMTAWSELLDRLPKHLDFQRLRAFAVHCAAHGIQPHAVDQGTLAAFVERRLRERGGGRHNDAGRRIANQWRQASREVTGWPQTVLLPTRQREVSRPLADYGRQLVEDVTSYAKALGDDAGTDIFAARVVRPRRTKTIEARLSCIRRVLHGAVEAGVHLERLQRLEAITERDVFRPAMQWHVQRAGGSPTRDIEQLAITAISVAQVLGLPAERLEALRADVRRLKPPAATSIAPRNAALIDALDHPVRRARLLHLPAKLMHEAARLRDGWTDRHGITHVPRPHEATWLAGTAVAVEILLHCPMRIGNLLRLRMGHELQTVPGTRSSGGFGIRVDGGQVKNRQAIEARLDGSAAALLRDYLERFRPLLPHAAGPWLFPSAVSASRPRDQVSFGRAISDVTHRHVGIRIHPHAFRSIAAALVLERDPHAIDDLRALLGHAGFTTALIYYRRSKALGAADRLAATVAQQRNTLLRPSSTTRGGAALALDLHLARNGRTRRGRIGETIQ